LKYGIESGKKSFKKKKQGIDRGMGLTSCIERYGEVDGKRKFKEWKDKVRQNEGNFILLRQKTPTLVVGDECR